MIKHVISSTTPNATYKISTETCFNGHTGLSWPRCWPKHETKTISLQGGHVDPGVASMTLPIFFFFGFRVNSGLGGGMGP